ITPLGVETMELADSTQINSLTLNASISGASADSGTMTLSGSVAPANKGMVTAYVLKPGFTISALTTTNFSTAVDFVGQKLTETDGSYSFGYTMQGAVNNTTYTAYAGGNSIAEPEDYSITFFGNDFVDRVVASFNGATAAQITQMLAGSIYVPNVTPNVYLNTVLNLDLTDYNTLNDYTVTESYKSNVAKVLEEITFSDTEHIRSEFNSAVSAHKTNQKNYLELLKKVNDALWGELELLFANNNSMLRLNYSGSYSKISSNSSLLEQFYKKLAQGYTFTDFDMLREKFESEAALLVPSETVNNDGGGGGGGKNFSYDDALKSENTLTPAPTQQSDEITSFDDLDSVLWAKEAILDLAEEGIVAGVGNNKFAPNETVTREQFVKMIVLTCGLYDENSENKKFVDVAKNAWYEKYVASAVNAGIIFGLDADHFGVGENISRAEMATILYRVLCHKGVTIETDGENVIYTDYNEIPQYARESVEALTRAGIMSGVGEGRFAANGEATRAMAARVIWLLKGEV
ncbi:MAG: S-layer homology domain-containing protein, partial [Oscillospiraceae bacterium]|nr:S-layer homology domain-containing protein [Oscillospiraceae bacterium]